MEPNSAINSNSLPRVLRGNQCIWPNPNLMLPRMSNPPGSISGWVFIFTTGTTYPATEDESIITKTSSHKIQVCLGVQLEILGGKNMCGQTYKMCNAQKSGCKSEPTLVYNWKCWVEIIYMAEPTKCAMWGNSAVNPRPTWVYNWKCWVEIICVAKPTKCAMWANPAINPSPPGCTIANAGWNQYVWLDPQNVHTWSTFRPAGDHPHLHITRNMVSLSQWLAHCRLSTESAASICHGTLSTSMFPWVMEHKGYTGCISLIIKRK